MRILIKSILVILIGFSQFSVSSCPKEKEEELKNFSKISSSETNAITSNGVKMSSSVVYEVNDKVFERGVCWNNTSIVSTIWDNKTNKTNEGNGGDYTSTTNNIETSYVSEYGIKTLSEDLETQADEIKIVSVTPIREFVDGKKYSFKITVSYQLNSHESGMLMIGFNNSDDVNILKMISKATKIIDNGKGQYTFKVKVKVKDWDTQGDFMAFVNLSENPKPSRWTPLANDTFILIPKK